MVASILQHNTGFAAAASTTFQVTLPGTCTAGNLIVWCAGGDKDIGTLTLTGYTLPVNLRQAAVSLVIAYKVAAGGEQILTGTITGANTGGSNLWACELSESGSGAWEEKATAATNNSNGVTTSNVSTTNTGTIGGGGGLALAAFSVDSVTPTVGVASYSDSFISQQDAVNGNAEAGLWIATKSVSAGGVATCTLSRGLGNTPDEMSAGMIVVGRSTGTTGSPTPRIPRALRTALVR